MNIDLRPLNKLRWFVELLSYLYRSGKSAIRENCERSIQSYDRIITLLDPVKDINEVDASARNEYTNRNQSHSSQASCVESHLNRLETNKNGECC
jgi:hypothetical protein